MKKGAPRNIAEETVDIIDDDGNVVGLISENELILELLFRDIFRRPDVLKKLEKDIQEINSLNPNQFFFPIEKALHHLHENPSEPPKSNTTE